jgi:23S rRNA (uracil1939-C5)-methyltransferase
MFRHAMYYLQNSPGLFQTRLCGNPAPHKKTPFPGRQPDRGIRWGIQFIHGQIVLPICDSFNYMGFYYRLDLNGGIMAPGDIFEAGVEQIAAGGAGLARPGGRVVFIPYSAPGDRLRGRIVREHGTWAEGEILELLEASPRRTAPRCPLYPGGSLYPGGCAGDTGPDRTGPGCGGCSLQHLNYGAQLEAKETIVREAFRRIAGRSLGETAIVPSPAWEYRNRVQLHRGPEGLGFKSAGSGRVIPLGDCPVAEGGIRALLRSGELRAPPGRDRFTLYCRGDLQLREGGQSRGKVKIRDRELLMDAGLFFQSNAIALESLIAGLLDLAAGIDPSLPLADLYCGVGTFAAFLAGRFPRIDLLEENPQALELAQENVSPAGARFFAMTDNEWVKKKEREGPGKAGKYGLIIADPPRQGLSPAMRRWLGRAPALLLAYVSCDPAALARDSAELARGWELADMRIFDFYPQTAHVESLAVFKRRHG